MSDLTDSSVRAIVHAEVQSIESDIRRDLAEIKNRIQDLHSIQADVQRTVRDVEQLMSQTKNVAGISSLLSQINLSIDEIRTRTKHAEETSRYTAGYVAMRLKERYDKQY